MKIRSLLLFSLLTLLAATNVLAQSRELRAKIPFEFSAAGKTMAAGEYRIMYQPGSAAVRVGTADGKETVLVTILTRTAASIHTTNTDSHLVFDRVGNAHHLSELWIPGIDGVVLNATKESHQHDVVDVASR